MTDRPLVLFPHTCPLEGSEALAARCEIAMPKDGVFPPQEMKGLLARAQALVANTTVDEAMIAAAPHLKIISNYGAGYDNVDVAAATRRGIPVTNIPDATAQATAELAMALLLCLVRRVAEMDRRIRRLSPAPGYGGLAAHTLQGMTLGIVGMGHIGRVMARMAAPFAMTVVYHNRRRLEPDLEQGAKYLPLAELLAVSDVVSLHTPLTQETRHMIGEAELQSMKPTAVLINTARGAVVDEAALVRALTDGVIAGAGLDVFEWEPRVPGALLAMENVVMTPHVGTNILKTREEMLAAVCERVLQALDGRRPDNVVNPEIYREER